MIYLIIYLIVGAMIALRVRFVYDSPMEIGFLLLIVMVWPVFPTIGLLAWLSGLLDKEV